MVEDQIKQLLVKAFRCLSMCYIVVFSGEAIDMEVIEARLKWSEAWTEKGESESADEELIRDTEWFVESQEAVVELLKDLCVKSYQRTNLVSAMVSLSNLLRQRGSVMSEMCSDDKEYLYKLFPQTFTSY
jgi:hypothetical protein